MVPSFKFISRSMIGFWLAILLSGCHPDVSFESEAKVAEDGSQYGTLTWSISENSSGSTVPTSATIEPGIGDVDFEGSIDVFPETTTTYTLTVSALQSSGGLWTSTHKETIHIGPRVDFDLFSDTNFRACVEETEFTHIEQFKILVCTNKNIVDLAGIEQLTDLTTLTLDINNIVDFSPLAALENVNTLSITNNNISDLSSFPLMPGLTTLVLFSNAITDITPLANNPQLLNLAVSNNQISDSTQFSFISNLQSLTVQNNMIEDISGLSAMTELLALDASDNQINDGVIELQTLTKAHLVDLRGNGDVKCLEYANLVFALGTAVAFDSCKLF